MQKKKPDMEYKPAAAVSKHFNDFAASGLGLVWIIDNINEQFYH